MAQPAGLRKGQKLRNSKYRIERILGSGSFGITYLATAKFTTQGNLGQMEVEGKVAIKEFFMSEVNARKEDGSTVEGSTGSVFTNYRKKFRKEAENLSKLVHPNIVEVFDVFDENNTTYYVMKFLEGQNLDDYIKQQEHLEEHEAISITNEIGSALDYMHSTKMLHLDIKPKNIMRTNDGKYFLIDFGLSKQFTDSGEPESSTSIGLGTPGYAPIEQSEYKKGGSFPATLDVYALSATLFKMLSGQRPPEATYILNEGFPVDNLVKAGVSEKTCSTVERGMSPMRKQRFQNIRELLNELANTDIEEVTVIKEQIKPKPNPKPIPEPKPELKPDPIHEPTPSQTPEPKSKLWKWVAIVVAFIGLGVAYYYNKEKSISSTVLTDPTTVEIVKEKLPETVTNMSWDSPLGKAAYTGAVQPDSVPNSNKLIPHGKGVAKITDGKYKGSIYDGELYWGKFEGKAKYTRSDGDIFEGTFKNNQYSNGTYTSKETGDYFKGTFKNEQPDKGDWYDKNGKKY